MTRYEVVFSARALVSLREVTRYIAEESGTDRAADWLARVMDGTATLESHPYAFPVVGSLHPALFHPGSLQPVCHLLPLRDRVLSVPLGPQEFLLEDVDATPQRFVLRLPGQLGGRPARFP